MRLVRAHLEGYLQSSIPDLVAMGQFQKHFSEKVFFFFFFLLERGREGEEHQCVVTSHMPPTGDLAHNPGMYPD